MTIGGSDARSRMVVEHYPANGILVAGESLVIADVMVGAIVGYGSVLAYLSLWAPNGVLPAMGGTIWRELMLVSVIAALIIRGTDRRAAMPDDGSAVLLLSLLQRCAACVAILAGVGLATGTLHDMARLWLLLWATGFFLWLCASRLALLMVWRRLKRRGTMPEGIAIIGVSASAFHAIDQLRAGARIVEVIDYPSGDAASVAQSLASIVALARSGAIGLVVLAGGQYPPPDTASAIVTALKAAPVRIAICPNLEGICATASQWRMVGGVPLMIVADRPLHPRDLLIKMLLDRFGALLLLLLVSPMLLAVALTVMLDTPGPVIFRQARTGWCGRLFTVYKFRTMRHEPAQDSVGQTARSDPRCTQVGSFLRRTSLDELPQLWNVLRGDMSLVGPRPHADGLHARERVGGGIATEYAQRHRVKPGLTGLAQVHGLRGAADTPEKLRRRIELDLYYIEHWSIWLDLKILARTPLAILSAENAF